MINKKKHPYFINDKIKTFDTNNFYTLATSLIRLLHNSCIKNPFVIGICGKSGAGKSYFLDILKMGFDVIDPSNKKYTIVNFDPLMYNDDDHLLWKHMIEKIYINTYKDIGLFRCKTFSIFHVKYKTTLKRFILALYTLTLFVVIPIIMCFLFYFSQKSTAMKTAFTTFTTICGIGLFHFIFEFVYPVLRSNINYIYKKNNNIDTIYSDLEDLFAIYRYFNRNIFLVIENLDRCKSTKIVEITDLISNVLSDKKYPMITFISYDEENLLNKIELYMKNNIETPEFDTNEYLSKIIQMPININTRTKCDKKSLHKILVEENPQLINQTIETCIKFNEISWHIPKLNESKNILHKCLNHVKTRFIIQTNILDITNQIVICKILHLAIQNWFPTYKKYSITPTLTLVELNPGNNLLSVVVQDINVQDDYKSWIKNNKDQLIYSYTRRYEPDLFSTLPSYMPFTELIFEFSKYYKDKKNNIMSVSFEERDIDIFEKYSEVFNNNMRVYKKVMNFYILNKIYLEKELNNNVLNYEIMLIIIILKQIYISQYKEINSLYNDTGKITDVLNIHERFKTLTFENFRTHHRYLII